MIRTARLLGATGLLNALDEDDGEAILNWLAAQPVVALVRFSDVQMLAQVLATLAERECCAEQPVATVRVLFLIRRMAPAWTMQRWALRSDLKGQRARSTGDEEAAS